MARPTLLMPIRPAHENERGVALLVVLFVLLLTAILALEIKSTAALHYRLAKNKRDDFLMRHAMRGHLEILKQVLQFDREENDVEKQDDRWTESRYTTLQELPPETDEEEAEEEPAEPVSSEDYEIKALVEDEARKFNLHNLLADDEALREHWEAVFVRLLVLYREEYPRYALSRGDAERLRDAVKEWLARQGDDVPRPATPDDKRIMVTPDELLMIKGFTRDILYDLTLEEEEAEEGQDTTAPGLIRYLTLWSDGPVNLNTAEKPMVRAMFESSDVELADRLIEWRNAEEEEEAGTTPQAPPRDEDIPKKNALASLQDFQKIDGFDAAALQRNKLNDSTVGFRSRRFSIRFTGESQDGLVRQERWVLERNTEGFLTLLYEERTDPVRKEDKDAERDEDE